MAPNCFARTCQFPGHPGDDELTTLTPTSLIACADFITRKLGAHQKDITGQLADLKVTLQANACQLNNITALLHEISHCLGVGTNQVHNNTSAAAAASWSGSSPCQHSIFPRWPWVDQSLVKHIVGGDFDIYDLPLLHRDEHLRNRHAIKAMEGVVYPLSNRKPHVVQAKTKLQSSLKDLKTLISAWMVYVSIRTFYAPERSPGLAIWTERLAFHTTLGYKFTVIVNYLTSYFRKHQNSKPKTWFNIDAELHTEHFGNAAQVIHVLAPSPSSDISDALSSVSSTFSGVSDTLSSGISGAVSSGIPNNISSGISHALSSGVSGALTSGVSDALPRRIWRPFPWRLWRPYLWRL